MAKPAVFVDRDGTLIEEVDYLTSADQIRFLPQAIPALKKLHQAGYAIVLVTNQSGVARGLLSEAELQAIHQALVEQVEMLGGHVDGVYYCPHLPPGEAAGERQPVKRYVKDCLCRKPKPGMFLQARDELGLDLDRSFAVGDAWRDVEAALAVGVPSVKVPRPPSRPERRRTDLPVLAEAESLGRAAEVILSTDAEEAHDRIRRARAATARPAAVTATVAVTVKKADEPEAEKPVEKASDKRQEATPRDTSKRVQEPRLDFGAPAVVDETVAVTSDDEAEDEARGLEDVQGQDGPRLTRTGATVEESEAAEVIEPQFDASLAHSPLLDRLVEETVEKPAEEAAVATVEEPLAAEESVEEEVGDMIDEETQGADGGAVETLVEERRTPLTTEDAEVETPEPEMPEGEAAKRPTCGRCGAEINSVDLATGKAGEVYETLLCRECYPEVSRMSQRAASRAAEVRVAGPTNGGRPATLDDVLAELRLLRKPAPPSDGLPWSRMIGTVAQVLAVALAVFPPIVRGSLAEAPIWLLAAIFMQLAALTMFVIARKKD